MTAGTPDLTTEDGVRTHLQQGPYPACNRVERLSDGVTGFVFRVWQEAGAEPSTFVVKHAEGYAARAPKWKLDQSRMRFEYEALKFLAEKADARDSLVRVPKVYHYDQDVHILVMEDAGSVPSLKSWLNNDRDGGAVVGSGEGLGRFLAKVHNASAGDEDLLQRFDGNSTAKYLSGTFFFAGLPKSAEKWGYTDQYFQQAAAIGQHEVNHSNEVLTLGDFWSGNVLISDSPHLALTVIDLEFSKPGTAAFDIGQMAAEMYFLAAFRCMESGLLLLHSFLASYRTHRRGEIDAAKVAIRVGAHFFTVIPSAWRTELSDLQIREQLKVGAELIRMGVSEDEVGLRDSILKSLFT